MPFRYSLKWLLVAMAYVAIAAAAFKDGWWIWADLLWGIAWLAWAYALLIVWLRSGSTRAGAAGFVIVMACYGLSVQFAPGSLPTERILQASGVDAHSGASPTVYYAPAYPSSGTIPTVNMAVPSGGIFTARSVSLWEPKLRAAHGVEAMIAGLAGLWLGTLAWRQSREQKLPATAATLLVVATLIGSGAAYGQDGPITYVDATDGPGGNTKLSTGEDFIPRVDRAQGSDNQWSLRAFGNGASVYTANDGIPSGPEDAPQLVTTIPGLTAGEQYNVFVYFWTDHHNWQIQATLEPPATSDAEVLAVTPAGDGSAAEATHEMFADEVVVNEANRKLMQASLGKVAADGQGEIRVWIDDVPGSTSATRTWYDGVGYVAEPKPAPVEMGSLLDWWPWIVMVAIAFPIFIMIAARRRGRISIVDEVPPT